MTIHRFELPDLLVTLCEKGQTSLAARIARSLLGRDTPHPRNVRERDSKDIGVTRDESKPSTAVELLERDLEPSRKRR